MERIIEQSSIRIVARSAKRVAIVCLVVARHPVDACATGRNGLRHIVERVIAEVLLPGARSAIDFDQSAKLIVTRCGTSSVVAGLRATRVEAVRDCQRTEGPI